MKSLCNKWVLVPNPNTSKEIVRFVHEVHPVFYVSLSTFLHIYVGEMMIPCQLLTFSEFICSAFQFQGQLAQKKSKCTKNTKWTQKLSKFCDVPLNGAFWTHTKYGVQISSKRWNPFVRDEFLFETVLLRERLSVLYTKCIQFLS